MPSESTSPDAATRVPAASRTSAAARLLVSLVLMTLATTAAPAADPPASSDAARTAFASAAALQNREAWDLAAEEWQALLTAHPNDPLALKGRYYLAVCQMRNGQWTEADKTLRAVIASPADAATIALARWDLGRGLFEQAQAKPGAQAYTAAAAALREFLAKSPKHPQEPDALNFLGESLWQSGSRPDALAAWQQFVREHPESPRLPDVLYALGIGQAETGKPAEAMATFATFAQRFPDHRMAADVALWRADLATAAGKPADAEPLLAAVASGSGPRAAEALDRLGAARWKQKNWAGAAEAYARLAVEHPQSPLAAKAAVTAGRALVGAGRTADARKIFEKSMAGKGPEAFEAAHRLAVLELEAKQPARALEVATTSLAAAAARKDLDRGLVAKLELARADALWEMPDRRGDAAVAYATIAERYPDSPVAASALSSAAVAALDQKRPADAIARADAYLAAYATKSPAENVLDVRTVRAEALLASGQAVAAAAAFGELAAKNPQSPRRGSWLLRAGAAFTAEKKWREAHDSLAAATAVLAGADRAEAQLLDGMTLLELDQPAAAAKLLVDLEKTQRDWPRRAEATLLAIRALKEAGDSAAALPLAEAFVKEFPRAKGSDVAWYRLGQLRQDVGKFDEAVVAYGESVAVAPTGSRAPAALLAAGWCHEARGRLPEAIASWTTLIDRHPDAPAAASALVARSDVRQRTRDYAGGRADAERVLKDVREGRAKLDGATVAEARLLEGLCLAGEKKYAQAAAAFRRLLDEQPTFAAADRVLFELGVTQTLDGKGPDAAASFATLAERFPKSVYAADAWLEVGESRWGAEKWEEAAAAYRAAIAAAAARGPQGTRISEQAHHKLGWTHVVRKDHAAAAEAFAAQIAAFPTGPLAADGQAMLGESLLLLDKPAEAGKAFAAALADPTKIASAELRGLAAVRASEAAARQERWQESLAHAEKFLAAEPNASQAPQARYAAAWALQNLGRLDEALAGYRALADASRTELAARARLMAGEVLFEQGNHKDAIKAFFKTAYGFGELQAPPPFHPWQAQATFEAARCFEVLGKPEQALTLYSELVARYPTSEQTPLARKRLEALAPAAPAAGTTTTQGEKTP